MATATPFIPDSRSTSELLLEEEEAEEAVSRARSYKRARREAFWRMMGSGSLLRNPEILASVIPHEFEVSGICARDSKEEEEEEGRLIASHLVEVILVQANLLRGL